MSPLTTGKGLLERLLSSESKGELLTLFHRNPGLIDSVDGIARRVGKTKESIEEDVKDFVDMGLLTSQRVGKLVLISLSREKDQEVQSSLADYFRSIRK